MIARIVERKEVVQMSVRTGANAVRKKAMWVKTSAIVNRRKYATVCVESRGNALVRTTMTTDV
jgi:hypothetical protein